MAKLQLLLDLKNKLKVGLDNAKDQVKNATGNMQGRLNAFKIKNIEAFNAIKEQVPGLSDAIGMLTNPYALAAAAVMALGMAVVSCTKMANEWHEQMAEINVTAELSKQQLGELSDKLLKIGGRNVAPLEEVPKAFNRIISAGLSVNDSLATLEPTLRAAKAGFVEVEVAATAATSVMMSAGVDAKKTFDVLFATQKAGNAEFKDIANYLPKVIPLARNLGLELEETAGAFASLTGSLKPEAAATALEGMMRALSNANVVKNLKKQNIDVFDVNTGKVKPIIDILSQLEKQMNGLSDKEKMLKFDQLGLDQSATLGISTLMQNLPKVKSDIDAVVNSAGALEKAYEDSLTPMENWKIIQNQVKVEMIKIGEYFLPIVSEIGKRILDIITYFKNLYNESILFRDILSGVGTMFEWAFKIKTIPIKFLFNMLKNIGNILTWVGKKVFGTGFSFEAFYAKVKPYLLYIKQLIGQVTDVWYKFTTGDFKGALAAVKSLKLPSLEEIKKGVELEIKNNNAKQESPPDFDSDAFEPEAPPMDNNTTYSDAASDATAIGKGSKSKSITINIESFIKGFSPTHQTINNMNKDELERWMVEMFHKVAASAMTM